MLRVDTSGECKRLLCTVVDIVPPFLGLPAFSFLHYPPPTTSTAQRARNHAENSKNLIYAPTLLKSCKAAKSVHRLLLTRGTSVHQEAYGSDMRARKPQKQGDKVRAGAYFPRTNRRRAAKKHGFRSRMRTRGRPRDLSNPRRGKGRAVHPPMQYLSAGVTHHGVKYAEAALGKRTKTRCALVVTV